MLKTEFVYYIPEDIEEGILYVSLEFQTSRHKCPCGCGNEIVVPFGDKWWTMTREEDKITFTPSIGNFYLPCKSHYYITKNEIIHCD